jgi:hypothetical protein
MMHSGHLAIGSDAIAVAFVSSTALGTVLVLIGLGLAVREARLADPRRVPDHRFVLAKLALAGAFLASLVGWALA